MPEDIRSRLKLALDFGLAWLLAAMPLIWCTPWLDGSFAWLQAAILRQGISYNWLGYLDILGLFTLRMCALIWLPLVLGLLLLLPMLALAWNRSMGCRRRLFAGLPGMLLPVLLHSLLLSTLLSITVFFFYLNDTVFSFGGRSGLPVEILVFLLPAMGAFIVLPRAVDNLSAEYSLLAGSLSGVLALLLLALPGAYLIGIGEQLSLLLLTNLGCGLGGLLTGLALPWLYRQDRGFWLELQQPGEVQRTYRIGPRPLQIGPQATDLVRLNQPDLPALRLTLSGLTLFLEIAGQPGQRLVYAPLRIHCGEQTLCIRSFDERDDREEYALSSDPLEPGLIPLPAGAALAAE
jgi:hypothetical protein